MSRLAVVEPKTLMGEAVREAIAAHPDSWSQIDLYTTDPEEVGAVTEVARRAALVQSLTSEELEAVDVLIFCGREISPDLLESIPERCRSIFIDPESSIERAVPAVAGINAEKIADSSRLESPAPGVLLLAHLLAPLRVLGELEVIAHVLQPASALGKAGLEELFAQTRAILSMSDDSPKEVFGTQLAFNLLPWGESSANLGADLAAILEIDLEARIHCSQAGVFHGCSVGLFFSVAEDPGALELQRLLLENPLVGQAERPELLGPAEAATETKILIGEITPAPVKGYWLWSCMDNLSLSAHNALALARA